MAKVLVVGGSGYVGSATCARLIDGGHDVWVLDDLSTGHRELALGRLVEARAGHRAVVSPLLAREKFDCVMHFAARSIVSESVRKPEEYYENNVIQTRELLDTMALAGVRRFIFSSTCAVFGDPGREEMHESLPKKPLNPYGATKLEVEHLLEARARDEGLHAIALRYFNAAGAEPGLRVGEWHEPETHLIPRILKAARNRQPVEIYGTDYPTPDGTCIRDYIHVSDLAAAHEAAMNRLLEAKPLAATGRFEAYNLGSESGYSVREIIRACEKEVGRELTLVERPRRAGDPPRLVANSSLARKVLGFKAERGLDEIVASAWRWEEKLQGLQKRAVFLDRDGTLNLDPGYINDPALIQLLPGAGEALARLKKAGFTLVVVSNQSGVGRGLIHPENLPKVNAALNQQIAAHGVSLDHFELCLHRPEEDCECRKPKPRLIQLAAHKLGIDLARSYMVGDKIADLQTGRQAGCRAVALVRTGYGAETEAKLAPGESDFVGDTLREVADWILSQETAVP